MAKKTEESAAELAAAQTEVAAEPAAQTEVTDHRGRIQLAVDNLARGRATPDDYEVLCDRAVMYHATMGQAMDIIEALQNCTGTVPVEVMWAAAVTLCTRVKQSPSFRSHLLPRSGPSSRRFRGARWSHTESDLAVLTTGVEKD